MNNYKNITKRVIFLLFMITLCSLYSWAQTQEAKEFVRNSQEKIRTLSEEAQQYYNENVRPLEAAINDIPESGNIQADEAKKRELQNDSAYYHSVIQQNINQIDNLNRQKELMTGDSLDYKIFSFSASLRNNNCNPQAIKELEAAQSYLKTDRYKKAVTDNLNILNNYQRYCDELIKPLKDIAIAIENNGGRKIEEGSKFLVEFDNSWSSASYIKKQEILIGEEENIIVLDDFVTIVNDLRQKGFEGSLEDINFVIAGLTPSNYEIESPLTEINNLTKEINRLTAETDSLKTVYNNINSELLAITKRIRNISTADDRYNILEQQRHDNTERWYDIHEELDNELIKICEYCLSQPYDENYLWLVQNVTPLLDNVFHKSYTARINQYRDLLNNYGKYTNEIYTFLEGKEIYTNNEDGRNIPEKHQRILTNDFNNLSYVRTYYNQKDDPKGVYSPYLNSVLRDFKVLWDRNFAHSKKDYEKLKSRVHISIATEGEGVRRNNHTSSQSDVPYRQPQAQPSQPAVPQRHQQSERPNNPQINPTQPENPGLKPDEPNMIPDEPNVEPDKPKVEPDKPKVDPDDPFQCLIYNYQLHSSAI